MLKNTFFHQRTCWSGVKGFQGISRDRVQTLNQRKPKPAAALCGLRPDTTGNFFFFMDCGGPFPHERRGISEPECKAAVEKAFKSSDRIQKLYGAILEVHCDKMLLLLGWVIFSYLRY